MLPTRAEFAGAAPPKDRPANGKSIAGYTRGESSAPREWICSSVAGRRIIRSKRRLLEHNSPLHYGRLYGCGKGRDGTSYKDVTNSKDPEVLADKARFGKSLQHHPKLCLPTEGRPTERKRSKAERKAKRAGRRRIDNP